MLNRRMLLLAFCSSALLLSDAAAPQSPKSQEPTMTHHAHGTFAVKMGAPTPGPGEGLSRFSMDKEIHGGLEGTSKGEMIAGGDYSLGTAGYVAMERVTGTLEGKAGSFSLQHTATMNGKALDMDIVVTPGSGTGELKGITGTFRITIKDGQHFYDLDYDLPQN